MLPVLTELINRSLLTSVFPSAWKESVVIPILKEGDHEVANNNRPVSLLPALSKICARVDLGAGPAVPNLCSLKSYVDDSQFYLTFPVQETAMAVEHLSEDLQQIAAWCCTHSLLINPDNTKLLLLGTPEMLARVPKGFGVTLLSKEILSSWPQLFKGWITLSTG